jgi:outer membrane protein insertion porin family
MQRIFKLLVVLMMPILFNQAAAAQVARDTVPVSVNPELENIFNSKIPKEYVVTEIKVTGAQFLDEALLISISGISVGDKIMIPGGDNFGKAINSLWKQNLFSNVSVFITKLEDRNISLEINVQERPRLSSYNFKNIKKSEGEDLNGKVGLVPGRVITENTLRIAVEQIEKYYIEKGYRNIKVQIEQVAAPAQPNYTVLVFTINKGSKIRVNNVNVFGNENVSDIRLKKQLKGTKEMSRFSLFASRDTAVYGYKPHKPFKEYLKEKGYLSISKTKEFLDPYFRFKLFSSSKFNDKKFEEDKQKVLEYYNSQGFRDASLVSDTQYLNRKGNLNVDLRVNEGRKYYFGDIKWRGSTKYSDSVLAAFLGIKRGDVYNLETLNRRLGKQLSAEGGDISGLYQDDGYLFFRVEAIETAVYNDTIDHEIRIVEGPQATIKNVVISGNEKTKEHVIRRELRTIPGEKFSRSDLIRSNREIANLNFFNQEKIGINPIPNQEDGTVDIHYSVEEKSSDQLELSAGWGGNIGLTGTLGITFNNFSIRNILKKDSWDPLPSGDGQKLSLRLQSNGRAFRSYNFSFTEPWLGGKKRNSFTISFFNTKFSNSFDPVTGGFSRRASDTSFLKTIGFSIALGKQLKWPDDFFTLVYSLNVTKYNLSNYPGFLRLSDGTDLRSGNSTNINLKVSLSRSSIDQPTFPSSGSSFTLSGQFTPPYSLINKGVSSSKNPYQLVEFHKWRFNGEWYVPLSKRMGGDKNRQFVLKAAAKFGFIGRYNNELEISPFERFQVGDAGLTNNFGILGFDIVAHRGYPVYESSNPKINPDQQGANRFFTMFNKYTLELRYPFSTNPSSVIYGLTFFEAANGWFSFKDYNPFKLRRSVGVGMRFFLPMFGLLGFDYGVGLDRVSATSRFKDATRFTFMLGFEPE